MYILNVKCIFPSQNFLYKKSNLIKSCFIDKIKNWDGMWESNPRMLEPQSNVLTTSPIPPVRL